MTSLEEVETAARNAERALRVVRELKGAIGVVEALRSAGFKPMVDGYVSAPIVGIWQGPSAPISLAEFLRDDFDIDCHCGIPVMRGWRVCRSCAAYSCHHYPDIERCFVPRESD